MRTIRESTSEYARGVAGGFLVSLPLLYTMEVWWQGFKLPPLHLIGFILVTFFLLLGYNRFSGMRKDASFLEVIIDSVEELGIGLVLSTLILFLLNQIWIGMPLEEAIGKIAIESVSVAIGVSVGTAQLSDKSGEDDADLGMDGDDDEEHPHSGSPTSMMLKQLFIGFCGAILIGGNVAPTEEVLQIAVSSSGFHLIGLALTSMLLIAVVLFFSDFVGAKRIVGVLQHQEKIQAVIVVYAVSLLASGLLLILYGQFNGLSLAVCAAELIVLAFVSSIGASAARLLIQ
jgi:putative integral membrane protein (TIGR02587 family)